MTMLATRGTVPEPNFGRSLAADAEDAEDYLAGIDAQIQDLGRSSDRRHRQDLLTVARRARERFFRAHAAALYDEATDGCQKPLRLIELVYGMADRFPHILPTRDRIAAERELMQQSAKIGHEIDQGLFVAHVLADPRCGMHLVHAMLKPKREALDRFAEFRRTGVVDLGEARAERNGKIGVVTLTNPDYLNAEGDKTAADLETAVDLVLLDDEIEVGVLRGGVVQHRKHAGRRIFNAGINLTHLYYGQISLVDFILERELGPAQQDLSRPLDARTPTTSSSRTIVEKPWLAVVESFAIGGGCQLLARWTG